MATANHGYENLAAHIVLNGVSLKSHATRCFIKSPIEDWRFDPGSKLPGPLFELLFGVELFDGRTDGETPHGGGEFF